MMFGQAKLLLANQKFELLMRIEVFFDGVQ